MSDQERLPQLPGEYTFKIFGRAAPTLVERIMTIIGATLGPVPAQSVSLRESSGGRYLSITIVLWVDRQGQLETVYAQLQAEPDVLLYI